MLFVEKLTKLNVDQCRGLPTGRSFFLRHTSADKTYNRLYHEKNSCRSALWVDLLNENQFYQAINYSSPGIF